MGLDPKILQLQLAMGPPKQQSYITSDFYQPHFEDFQ